MQEKHEIHDTSSRTQRLVEYLGTLAKRDYEPSADVLKDITHFVFNLAEPYRTIGLRALAAHFVNSMSLYYLQLMATFQEKAEKEGFEQEEMIDTFDDIMPQWLQKIMELDFIVTAQSADDLVKLANITIGLFRPSQLQRLSFSSTSLNLYGLNTIEKLQTSPFFLADEEKVAETIQAACRDIC